MKRSLPRRSLAVGAVVAAVVAVAVVAFAFARSDTYEAEAAVEVIPVLAADETFAGFSVLRAGRDPVETAAQLIETQPVANAVAVRLRLEGADEALDAVHAEAEPRGGVVHVCAKASTGVGAARLANAFADELVRQRSSLFQSELQRAIDSLRAQLAGVPATRRDEPPASELARRLAELRTYEGRGDPSLRIAATATAPDEPDQPRPLAVLAIGLPLALLLGAAAALVHAALRRRAPGRAPAADDDGRRAEAQEEQDEQARRLNERIEAVTARELELARRAAQLARREQELQEREQTLEPEPDPVSEPEPGPELEPEPATPPLARNLVTLEHLVSERERELSPERRDELHAYLAYLRPFAEPDGTLPSSFDPLVDEVFAELLRGG